MELAQWYLDHYTKQQLRDMTQKVFDEFQRSFFMSEEKKEYREKIEQGDKAPEVYKRRHDGSKITPGDIQEREGKIFDLDDPGAKPNPIVSTDDDPKVA